MKKSSIDVSVLTPVFRRMCMGGFFLYLAAFMPLPVLFVRLGESAWMAALAFVGGMLVAGPFNAYLGDTYRRKHVFIVALAAMLAVEWGFTHVQHTAFLTALTGVMGICFALATAAGVTVSIDVTLSGNRTRANMIYACLNRTGMFLGMALGLMWFAKYDWNTLVYASISMGMIGILEVVFVYLPFRAPMGVGVVNLDRFFLPRAWLPAINVGILALACGMGIVVVTDLVPGYAFAAIMVVALAFVPSMIKMFVKLSHHCQRGTGNTTFNLASDAGVVLGMALAVCLAPNETVASYMAVALLALGLLLLGAGTYPYYRKRRVR